MIVIWLSYYIMGTWCSMFSLPGLPLCRWPWQWKWTPCRASQWPGTVHFELRIWRWHQMMFAVTVHNPTTFKTSTFLIGFCFLLQRNVCIMWYHAISCSDILNVDVCWSVLKCARCADVPWVVPGLRCLVTIGVTHAETVLVHTESGIVVDQMDAHKQKTRWKLLTQGSRSTVDINWYSSMMFFEHKEVAPTSLS